MLAIRLPSTLEARLDFLSERTGRPKSYYARQAIEEFLEDREDYLLAVSRLEEKNPRISLEEVRRLLELED
jgi:RHH-type rel operon transcriptional repressor/antitoxin RelB